MPQNVGMDFLADAGVPEIGLRPSPQRGRHRTRLGVEKLIACEAETVDGQPHSDYTGRPTGTPSYKEGKIVRTEAWLTSLGKTWSDFERSYFYSDSHNDIPLLQKVTDPIATNPDDTLRAHAQAHGWRILELFQPT